MTHAFRILAFFVGTAFAANANASTAPEPPLRTPDDLALDLVAREPLVAQPVFLNFDERGRMWVVQYLQYPEPAGLKVLARDSVWRVRYDRKKPAPPYDTPATAAFRGRDRIVILEDVKGDGSFTQAKTFVDGLNIASAVVRGRGGVWVLSPPQLLWYSDLNDDDVPDGPPSVALDGFGIEDTHSIANSLRWGPDGWLYGAVGSTVTGDIVRPGLDVAPIVHMVGQGIWRYHAETRRFEVFAEGGGNAFGVEIDAKGRVFSGHNGGDTRGFHYVQGGYLRKGFEKHGELSNPYAFGFFPAMKHARVNRFTHNFILYDAGALPAHYRGKLIGIDPMNHYLPLADITPRGATFETRDIGAVIQTEDRNFRPVDIKHGPDGAIYVADWRDLQINHYLNHEGQITREDGRIYRVRARDAKPGYAPFDLRRKTTAELIALLRHDDRWWRETALQMLGERRDPAAIAPLRAALARNEVGQFALEALWALNLSGGFDEALARTLFAHADLHVRSWAVRLVGDTATAQPETARALAELARVESQVEVRSQLAASAKRWPVAVGLPVVQALLGRSEDLDDPYVPLQLWWAIERAVGDAPERVLTIFAGGQEESPWRYPIVAKHIAARLMRRFAAAGGTANLLACARLLDSAPTPEARRALVQGFEQAFAGRALPGLPEPLAAALVNSGAASLTLRMRRQDPAALAEGLRLIRDPRAPLVERVRAIATFGEVPHPPAAAELAALLVAEKREIVEASLAAAAAYDEPALTEAIVARYALFSVDAKALALAVLTSRRGSGQALLDAVEAGRVTPAQISLESREKLRLVADAPMVARIDRLLGAKQITATATLDAEIARVASLVRASSGNLYAGRAVFEQRCSACHRFFNTGGAIGPDLTSFKREDVASLVLAIVNPNAEMREGYEPFVLTKKDGTVHSGFLSSQDARQVVIRDMAGLSATVARSEIASLQGLGSSLMPAGLLAGLPDRDLHDLFAYLRIQQPLVGKE